MTELAGLPSGRPSRLVYFGTPEIAVPPLEALVENGFDVALVVTRVDNRRGRGSQRTPSAVKLAAQRLGLPVSHIVADALGVGAELGVVVAFGQLIKAEVLEVLPMVNLHFSLLPRWRGAAPVERALLAGDAVTGVSLMQLEIGLDTGPVIDAVEVPIGPRQSVDSLRRDLVRVGADLLVRSLASGLGQPVPQSGEITEAAKLAPAEFAVEWTRPAAEIDRLVRLGVAWTFFRGRRLKLLEVEPRGGHGEAGVLIEPLVAGTGEGLLELCRVQPEGKPAMDARSWANGARPARGERLGEPGER